MPDPFIPKEQAATSCGAPGHSAKARPISRGKLTAAMHCLVIQTGNQKGKRIILRNNEIIVGRDPGCQIRVQSSAVSRNHCAIRKTAAGLLARDLGSRNRTFVNDIPIEEETRLKLGDLLRVGPMVLEVVEATIPSAQNSATDDDIADWLTEEKSGEMRAQAEIAAAAGSAPPAPKPATPDASEESDPIAKQAGEIIRRHWEEARNRKP